jgi:hypothetical protein
MISIVFKKILNKIKFIALLVFIFVAVFAFLTVLTSTFSTTPPKVYAATTRIDLGTVDSFAVFSAAAITDSAPSVIIGDVGATPIAGSAIGIPALEVTGTIYAVDGTGPSGSINNPGLLTTARASLLAAYDDAAGRTSPTEIATNLGGVTKTAGVYDSADTTFTIAGGGNFDAQWRGER